MNESRIRYFLGKDFFETETNPLHRELAGVALSPIEDIKKLEAILALLKGREYLDDETVPFIARAMHGHYGAELDQYDIGADDFIAFWQSVNLLHPHVKIRYVVADLKYLAGASIDDIGVDFIEALRADMQSQYSISGDVSEALYASKHAFEYHLVLFEKMAKNATPDDIEAEFLEMIEQWGADPEKLAKIQKVKQSTNSI